MSRPFDVDAVRRQFPALAREVNGRPAVYLDGPGGSQVPRRVIDAVADCLAHANANDGGAFATSRAVGGVIVNARRTMADLLNAADPDEIVFGPNMTSLTFAVSRALSRTWKTGDEVIVTRLDHDANVTPWVLAAKEAGATVRAVPFDPADCTLRMDALAEVISPRTKLVAVGLASNAVGTVNPVRQVVAAAKRVGAVVYVDAVHAAPHLPVDVAALGADFVACSVYKFFGPHLGAVWGRRELWESLTPHKLRASPDTVPGRWMTGTANFEAMAGTTAAVEHLASLGEGADRRAALASAFAAIKQHETALAARFLAGVAKLPAWKVWGITDPARLAERVATFGLTHRTRPPAEVAEALGDRGLFVWNGHFYALDVPTDLGLPPGGLVRVGFLHYTTAAEVDRLLEELAALGG